jgi:hypothetical protein
MSTEASCRKYLDAVAKELVHSYDFDTVYSKPTDLLKMPKILKRNTLNLNRHKRKFSLIECSFYPLIHDVPWIKAVDMNAKNRIKSQTN